MATTAPHRRTQVQRRTDSEEALLEAAAQLVAERGVEGASLARIGERAGTSRGLPTHHFGSKDVLVARLARQAQNQIDDAARAAVEARDGDASISGLELVRSTVDVYLQRFEHPTSGDRALIVMWGATFPAEASVEGMVEADQRSYDGWAELIREGQRDGSINVYVDARSSALLLHGLLRGVAAIVLTDPDRTDVIGLREACQTWISAALASP
jgi:AcrR family transcriptional regulator